MLKDLRPELKEVYYLEAEIKISKDGTYTITDSEKRIKATLLVFYQPASITGCDFLDFLTPHV